MNVILIGYRCTGKTSVGRLLAEMSGRPFFDTDELVCRRSGRTIAAIVAASGWQGFRAQERAAVEELARLDGVVVSTGGGVVLDPVNVELLRSNGFLVWLAASAETITKRMQNDVAGSENRPSLSGKPLAAEVREMLAQRTPLYRQSADMTIATDKLSEAETVKFIRRNLPAGFSKGSADI